MIKFNLTKFQEFEIEWDNSNKLTFNVSNRETTIERNFIEKIITLLRDCLVDFAGKNLYSQDMILRMFSTLEKEEQIDELIDLMYELDITIEDLKNE